MSTRADLVGKTFGELKVVSYLYTNGDRKAVWLCLCSCGKEVSRTTKSIRRNPHPSCGCSNPKALRLGRGTEFEEWTIISRAPNNKDGQTCWNCRCSCGKEVVVLGTSLIQGRTSSCGCVGSTMVHPKRNREKNKNYALQRKYGITLSDYTRMLEEQGKVCAICREGQSNPHGQLLVDHRHATGEVRGLLCTRCNTGLGMFRDQPEFLRRAAAYLGGRTITSA